jgi:endonuclease YncB( thermonuclease family)
MLGFGRKDRDFEWHKYVRTTIKLRREDRRARIAGARDAAVGSLKEAGAKGYQGVGQLMKTATSAMFALPGQIGRGIGSLGAAIGPKLSALGEIARPLLGPLSRPGLPPLFALFGAVALAAAIARARAGGWDAIAVGVGSVGVGVLVAAIGTILTGQYRVRLPSPLGRAGAAVLDLVPRRIRPAAGLIALVLAVAGAGWLAWSQLGGARMASVASLPLIGGKTIEGRGATAVSGDVIRLNGVLIRLTGIEAPDREQRCAGPGNKRWRCGEAASEALGRIVRGRQIRCDVRGTDDAGRSLGTCHAGSDDIAAKAVREGAVFALGSLGGLFASYGAAEREARAQKAGLWRVAEVERPAEWRTRLWDAARKAAPDGCPIKGQVSSGRRTFLMPWSPDYDGAKVRTSRGERWFCSESEATAAGWKLAQGS